MSRVRRIGATRIDLNELIKRGALAVLSILAVLLPILKVSFTSESDDIVLGDFQLLGGAAYLFAGGISLRSCDRCHRWHAGTRSLHRRGRTDHCVGGCVAQRICSRRKPYAGRGAS